MTNKMMLCVAVFAIVLGQACSKDHERQTSEYKDEGTFTGDPETTIKSDGKFLCDFQWTPGPKNWNYKNASGDNPVVEKEEAKEPWCLIPYEDSTKFFITTKSDENVEDYVCRDLNAQYSLKNEEIIDIIAPVNGEYIFPYKTHKQMMCIPINNVVVTAKNSDINLKDEKLYHIREIEGLYSIEGHINLRLVKQINLSVLWEPILNENLLKNNVNAEKVNKIKEDWKMYMKKVGYYIDIKTLPVVFPNNKSYRTKEERMTLMEDGKVLKFPDAIDWHNESINKHSMLPDIFGVENLSTNETFDYVFTVVPNYNIKHNIAKVSYTAPKNGEVNGTCKIMDMGMSSDVSGIIKGSLNEIKDDGYYYNALNTSIKGSLTKDVFSEFKVPLSLEIICTGVTMFIGEIKGGTPKYFDTKTGYVITHEDFFKKNNPGRLMAAITYSKILGRKPINDDNGRWLSSYTDESEVEQPRDDWRGKKSGDQQENIQQQLLEFASIMQYFKGE